MTVNELIATLVQLQAEGHGANIVVIAKDGEGNNYSPLADVDESHVYMADSTWSGDIGYAALTDELREMGYTDDDVMADGKPALILWPVN